MSFFLTVPFLKVISATVLFIPICIIIYSVFISWVGGSQVASETMAMPKSKRIVSCEKIFTQCNEVNPAIIADDVKLYEFIEFFTEDAWHLIDAHGT